MSKFLICGQPRSMTFWFSKFLSFENCWCDHEPLMFMNKKEDIRDFYDHFSKYIDNFGISDSGLGFWLDWILDKIKPNTLIINRDIEEVEKSLVEMGLNLPKTNFCNVLQKKMDAVNHELVMRVNFHDLQDMEVMKKCFYHLLPNEEFDDERFRLMIGEKYIVNPHEKLFNLLHNGGDLFREIPSHGVKIV